MSARIDPELCTGIRRDNAGYLTQCAHGIGHGGECDYDRPLTSPLAAPRAHVEYNVPTPGLAGTALAALQADNDRLRARTHEIQERADKRNASLQSLVDEARNRWAAAEREVAELVAEWADVKYQTPGSFWGMTSQRSRDTLMRLVAEREEARSQRAAALALHPREEWSDDSLNGVRVVCGNCLDASEDPIPWPCPNAEALGELDA